jgi:hypothetical protein
MERRYQRRDGMNDFEKVSLAFDILNDADIVEEFEDTLFIKVDKQMWNEFWDNASEEKQNEND